MSKNERILSQEEIKACIDEQVGLLETEINRWVESVDVNTTILNKGIKPNINFFAKMTCSICGHEHYVNNMDRCQINNCEMAISANLLNSVCGFVLNSQKINELKQKLNTETDQRVRETIQATIKNEENYYHVRFLCGNCANQFQDEFRKVFDAKIREYGIKHFI
jgi:transposase-like protein